MSANTNKLQDSLGSRAKKVSGLMGNLRSGSASTAPQQDSSKIQEVQSAVSDIHDFVSNTSDALTLLESKTGATISELQDPLKELSKIASDILDSKVEVSKDQSKRFVELLDKVDTFVSKNKKLEVGGTTLKAFLSSYESQQGKQTLASKDLKSKVEEVSNTIGSSFGSFLTENIQAVSTTNFGDAAKNVAIATLAGPLAPIVSGLTDLVDLKSVFGGITKFAKKGIALVKKKKVAKDLTTASPDTEDFRTAELDNLTTIETTLTDGFKDMTDAVDQNGGGDGGGGGGGGGFLGKLLPDLGGFTKTAGSLLGKVGKLAGPLAAVAAAGAAGYGIGTEIRKGLDSLTGGKFTKGVGEALGSTVDHVMSLFGNKDAKQRLALADKLNRPKVIDQKLSDIQSQLGGKDSTTNVAGFRNVAQEMKQATDKAKPLQKAELLTTQIQTLQQSLQSSSLDKTGRSEVEKLIVELQKDREATGVFTPPKAIQVVSTTQIAKAQQPEITAPTVVTPPPVAPGKQTLEVKQRQAPPSVNSVPMVNDDMGLQLVNSGTL